MAFYTDLGNCEGNLPRQSQLFSEATGLTPLVAYCMLDSGLSARWLTRVDGIGTTEYNPDTAAIMLWGDLLDFDQVAADLTAAAEAQGLRVFEIGMGRGHSYRLWPS